jgi:hypothetical protein
MRPYHGGVVVGQVFCAMQMKHGKAEDYGQSTSKPAKKVGHANHANTLEAGPEISPAGLPVCLAQ